VTVGVTGLTSVTTYHNNLLMMVRAPEYALTTSNVTTSTFGVFSCTINSPVYAQPLWVRNLTIGGGMHNVVFVASSRGTVYASMLTKVPCDVLVGIASWLERLLERRDVGSGDIQTDIGIVGTPVIDLSTQTYVVTNPKTAGLPALASCHQRLHALNLADHAEKFGAPTASHPRSPWPHWRRFE
jgi:hypothetical protein